MRHCLLRQYAVLTTEVKLYMNGASSARMPFDLCTAYIYFLAARLRRPRPRATRCAKPKAVRVAANGNAGRVAARLSSGRLGS